MERLREFLDIFKKVKHQRLQPKFCPSCRSTKIYPKESYGIYPSVYSCRDCGYEGNIVLEMDLGDQE